MISLRGLFQSSIIYGLGSAVMRIMTFLLLPLYTNSQNSNGEWWYANYAIIITTIAFLRICYSHGTGDSFLKLYSQEGSKEKKQKIISTYIIYILLITIIASSVFVILNFLIGEQNTSSLLKLLQDYIYYILLIVVFDTLNYRVIDILRIKNYALYYMLGQIVGVICTLGLAYYYVVKSNLGLEGALIALLTGSIITCFLFVPMLIRNISIPNFSIPYLKEMLNLGIRFFPAALFFMCMALLDRYLLWFFLDGSESFKESAIGAYSVGAKLASVPMLLISAFNLGWQPFYLTNGTDQKAIDKYQKIGTIFTVIVLSITWVVAIIMPIVGTWNIPYTNTPIIGQNYSDFINVIPIILISHVFYALYIINMPSIYLCNKQNWSPIFRMFGALINIILNIILIPKYGIEGAAIATALSYGCMFIFLFYKNKKWMPINLAWTDIIILSILILTSIITMNEFWYVTIITLFYIGILHYKHGIKNLISLFK